MKTLKQEIKSLEIFLGEDDGNANSVAFVIENLSRFLDDLPNQAEWSGKQITEYVFSENDPLDHVDGVSDSFRENVREIQHGIVNHFSLSNEKN